jgi:SAM-dependent methyltransferase
LSLNFRGELPSQLALAWDGDNLAPVNRFQGKREEIGFCDYLTSALPYHLLDRPEVLIIGPGGGTSLLTALYHRAKKITALELNPLVIALMQGELSGFSGDIYHHPTVTVLPEEGRSFLTRPEGKYDLIQIPLLDSFAAASSGVYSLAANHLYTVESFQEIYRHLKPGGTASITRWLRYPPRDSLRIFATAVEALRREGIAEPRQHLVFIRGWTTGTILMKQSEFTPRQVEVVLSFCRERGFDPVFLPDSVRWEPNRFHRLPSPLYFRGARALLDPEQSREFVKTYPFDISPARDDKPFFYNFFRFKTLSYFLPRLGKEWVPLGEWGYLVLWAALIQAGLASLIFIFLPILKARGSLKNRGREGVYFFALGIGYLFIEISLIHKLILFLGHPVSAVSIVIFSILLFSSLGSWLSDKLIQNSPRSLAGWLMVLAGMILVYIFSLPPLIRHLLAFAPLPRRLLSVLILAPLGLLMGIPFPAGLKIAGGRQTGIIPWAWAVNGCASVMAAVLAEMAATAWGFSSVLILALSAYLIALISLRRRKKTMAPH